jgi:hypothetical protein
MLRKDVPPGHGRPEDTMQGCVTTSVGFGKRAVLVKL